MQGHLQNKAELLSRHIPNTQLPPAAFHGLQHTVETAARKTGRCIVRSGKGKVLLLCILFLISHPPLRMLGHPPCAAFP